MKTFTDQTKIKQFLATLNKPQLLNLQARCQKNLAFAVRSKFLPETTYWQLIACQSSGAALAFSTAAEKGITMAQLDTLLTTALKTCAPAKPKLDLAKLKPKRKLVLSKLKPRKLRPGVK